MTMMLGFISYKKWVYFRVFFNKKISLDPNSPNNIFDFDKHQFICSIIYE